MLVEKEIAGRDLQEQITGKTDLQEEVIVEILSRLPVKSLLKFKSVCKGWYEIIKNPYLINKHLHNHYENDNGHLLVQRFIPESQLYGFESFTDKTLANLDQIVVDPYLQNTVVQGNSSPSLPSHPITVQLRVEDVYLSPPVLGFRHDPSANEYKGRVMQNMWVGYGPPSPFLHLTLYKGRIATCSPMWNGQIANSYSYAEINVNIEIDLGDGEYLGPRGLSHVYIHKESLVTLKGGNGSSKEDVSTNLVAPIRVFFNLCPRRSCIYGEGLEKLTS
ncbi:hypothetical protein LguiB_019099 [Lonicera macranthoides]